MITDTAPNFMGMTSEMIDKYNREYMRLNPHNLPELSRKQRPRIIVKASMPEMVYSTRNIA